MEQDDDPKHQSRKRLVEEGSDDGSFSHKDIQILLLLYLPKLMTFSSLFLNKLMQKTMKFQKDHMEVRVIGVFFTDQRVSGAII